MAKFKTREELKDLVDHFASDVTPVGMDVVYVHAIILDKLVGIETRLEKMEAAIEKLQSGV